MDSTKPFYLSKADAVWNFDTSSNSSCWVLKIADKYRVLKKYYDKSLMHNCLINEEKIKLFVPLAPMFIDCSENYPNEASDWILMDYIPSMTLTNFVKRGLKGGRIKDLYYFEIFSAIIFQLCAMKKNHIIHRDLKPDNIILDGELVPHIVDWDECTDQALISNRPDHGTVTYAAPEIFISKRMCESDIFSFGGIMLEMITGHPPFEKAFLSKDGLKSYVDQYDKPENIRNLKETFEFFDEFETMNQEMQEFNRPTIVHEVEQILMILIQAGIRDDEKLIDEQFTSDKFNKGIASLILECWKEDPSKRIVPSELMKQIKALAKEILDPADYEVYEIYCNVISKRATKEYGTEDEINKVNNLGFFECNDLLKQIMKDSVPIFIEPECSLFEAYFQTLL